MLMKQHGGKGIVRLYSVFEDKLTKYARPCARVAFMLEGKLKHRDLDKRRSRTLKDRNCHHAAAAWTKVPTATTRL